MYSFRFRGVLFTRSGKCHKVFWFDWNLDGDWDDVMKCPRAVETVPVPVPEWAVQNR